MFGDLWSWYDDSCSDAAQPRDSDPDASLPNALDPVAPPVVPVAAVPAENDRRSLSRRIRRENNVNNNPFEPGMADDEEHP